MKKVGKNEKSFIKYLSYSAYLFIIFLVITTIQFILDLSFPKFVGSISWSLFISIRLIIISLAAICTLIYFVYLILYALKDN